jgi:RimJ/RimL family protein N-acetyltransferase
VDDPRFDSQPSLLGNWIRLRPLTPDDHGALFEAASDPLIWEQHPEPDRCTPTGFRRFFDGAMASGGALAVVERASGRVIGSSRFANWRPAEREIEIGWTFLERRFWGGSYNAELKALMLDHAFRWAARVVFRVDAENLRSRRALEKIGARRVREDSHRLPDGTMRRSLEFVLTGPAAPRASFANGPGAPEPSVRTEVP